MAKKTALDEDQLAGNAEDRLNPGANRLFDEKGNATSDDLASLESDLDKKYSQDFNAVDNSKKSLKDSEENPEQPTSLYKKEDSKKKNLSAKLLAGSKRFGPTGGVVGLIFAAFGITSGFGGPASLLVAFSDLTSNHTGISNHLYIKTGRSYVASFLKGETRDCATSKIKCKFTTISEERKAEWEKRGIKVNVDPNKNALGRYKVRGLEYKNTKITNIRDYKNLRNTSPEFNSLLKRFPVRAYLLDKGPFRFGTLSKFNLNLSNKFKSSTKEKKEDRVAENKKAMNDKTSADVDEKGNIDPKKTEDKGKKDEGRIKEVSDKLRKPSTGFKIASGLSATTALGCMAYDIVRVVQASTILLWNTELIEFALPFLEAGAQAKESGINDGFDWATAEYFGDRLMQPITQKDIDADPDDNITQDMLGKTAMDSKGMDAVINGGHADVNTGYASQYTGWMPASHVVGAGIVKKINGLMDKGSIRDTCTVAKAGAAVSSLIQCGASLPKCVAAFLTFEVIANVWGDEILNSITDYLQKPALDAIAEAGLNSSLHGPPLGQALVSAAGVMSSNMDMASGFTYAANTDQAIQAYNDMYTDPEYIQTEIAEAKSQAQKNQFDIKNRYSFVGQLASKFTRSSWDGTLFSSAANLVGIVSNSQNLLIDSYAMQQGLYQPVQVFNSEQNIKGTINNCKSPGMYDLNTPCLGESGRPIPTIMPAVQDCMNREENDDTTSCVMEAVDYLSQKVKYTDESGNKQPYIDKNSGQPTGWSGKPNNDTKSKNPFIMFMAFCGRDRKYPIGYTDKTLEGEEDQNKNIDGAGTYNYDWQIGKGCIAGSQDDTTLAWMSYYYHMCIAMYASEENQDYCWDESATPAPSGGPWVVPTTGPCLSPYGMRWGKLHAGIDISPPQGTPIVAPTDLKIISAAGKSDGYGNSVVARATDGTNYMFRFGHMLSIAVTPGQTVSKGTPLGAVGSTGDSTGPHLHFEIYDPSSPDGAYASNGKPIDPVPVLAQHGVTVTC